MSRLSTKKILEALEEGQVIGPVQLIEDADFFVSSSQLVEGVLEGKQQTFLEVEGRFQHADMKNHNGRIYPRSLWERVLGDQTIKEQLERGAMHGHLDHPEDGKTLVEKVSHIIQSLKMDEKTGEVIGRARVLNNQWGNQLRSIFEAGGTVGISSRGSGSVKMVNGVNVVQEDFRLNTFDFVNVPSTPNAFPKPVGEDWTAINSRQLRNENLEEESMSASLKKLNEVRTEVSVILTAQPEKLNEGGKSKYLQDLDAAEYKINKLIQEDAGVSSLAQPLLKEVTDKRNAVKKLIEHDIDIPMSTPPVMTGMVASRISERKCICGFPGCECQQGVCECYNKAMGFMESAEFEDFDLESFLSELEAEEEENDVVEDDDNETVSTNALQQHLRVAQKVHEADRSASGQVIAALAQRIRTMMSTPSITIENQAIIPVEEYNKLKEENDRLKGLLSKVSERVTTVAESFDKGAAIDAIIAEEPKAKLWVSRMLKANSIDELKQINETAKAEILVERSADPTLPPKGAVKVEGKAVASAALDEGAALAFRMIGSMRSKNTLISRGGQILEAHSNVK